MQTWAVKATQACIKRQDYLDAIIILAKQKVFIIHRLEAIINAGRQDCHCHPAVRHCHPVDRHPCFHRSSMW